MGKDIITNIVTVLVAIIGVAIVAVLVSKNAQTPQVLSAGGNAFANILKQAVSPVSGGGGFAITQNASLFPTMGY